MTTVTATEFIRNFGDYSRRAQREPVAVTNHGRTTGYFVSAEEFEEFQRVRASRRAYHPRELPADLKAAVRDTRMDARHEHLNALLKE